MSYTNIESVIFITDKISKTSPIDAKLISYLDVSEIGVDQILVMGSKYYGKSDIVIQEDFNRDRLDLLRIYISDLSSGLSTLKRWLDIIDLDDVNNFPCDGNAEYKNKMYSIIDKLNSSKFKYLIYCPFYLRDYKSDVQPRSYYNYENELMVKYKELYKFFFNKYKPGMKIPSNINTVSSCWNIGKSIEMFPIIKK